MRGRVRILLVEDDPSDVALAVHAFERHDLAGGVVGFYRLLLNRSAEPAPDVPS